MLLRFMLLVVLLVPGILHATPTILVFGDSLSAAYGIPRDAGWVSLMETRLSREKLDYRLVNASISGETTAGGLSRIEAALAEHSPVIVILELGANDGLRGLPLASMQRNLEGIIRACQQKRAKVLLIGMRLPPNYGPQYTQKFLDSYAVLAKKRNLALVPFLLAGVLDRSHFQADGLHPTTAAQAQIMENVWTALRPMLKEKNRKIMN